MVSVFSAAEATGARASRATSTMQAMPRTDVMGCLLVSIIGTVPTRSPELRDDFLAEELEGREHPGVGGAGRMPKADEEVVRPHLAVPHLDLVDAVRRRAEDEPVERDPLEGQILGPLDVLIVRALAPVVAMRAQQSFLVFLDGLLARGSHEALAEHDDLRGMAAALGGRPVERHPRLE